MSRQALGTAQVIVMTCSVLLASPAITAKPIADPLEPLNRVMHGLNVGLEYAIIRPVAWGYETLVPRTARVGIGNVLSNLATPLYSVNFLLQGKGAAAGDQATRFFINSTLGLAGIFDVANHNRRGIPRQTTRFGDTLAAWGAGEGIYVVLPFFGPSTSRDAGGLVVDTFIDPVDQVLWRNIDNWRVYRRWGVLVHESPTIRDRIDAARETATGDDFYITLRSLYTQRRRAELGEHDFDEFEDIFDSDMLEDEVPDAR
ncbi:MAG: VacJ family lipoprotein [Pseudomonadota bacterium]